MTASASRKILVVYGTRPEAIKMAPLVGELAKSHCLFPVVAVTGQHRAMLDQVNALFGITPQHDLNIMSERQQLEDVAARILSGLGKVIESENPAAVAVQGDTTTCFAAALAAFYRQVPVVHLEAGLRSGDISNPYPEEMNRRLATRLASVHLAPTNVSKANLLGDGVASDNVYVTGNTVIDALHAVLSKTDSSDNPVIERLAGRPTVLITAHRRESWGAPMASAARAIGRLARDFPDFCFLLPAHLNPAVREVLLPPLQAHSNVVITEPLAYSDFARAMQRATLILTDSGGVQEEAPSLGKPVLVMRDTTERPEAVAAGTVRLVGTDELEIYAQVSRLLTDRAAYLSMSQAANPYGDGRSAARSRQAIEHFFGLGPRPEDFAPARAVPRAPVRRLEVATL